VGVHTKTYLYKNRVSYEKKSKPITGKKHDHAKAMFYKRNTAMISSLFWDVTRQTFVDR
jgi:hypothetical protein